MSVRALDLAVLVLVVTLGGCAPGPVASVRATSGDERPAARDPHPSTPCIDDADRASIDVSASPDERFEEAFDAVDVPADSRGLDSIVRGAANVRALALFDSIERDSTDPAQARISAMLAIEVLEVLAAERPACGLEACARVAPVLLRHCPVELPHDDLTAVCPTLVLYGERCAGVAR